MNLLIFGPPGIGKSSVVEAIHQVRPQYITFDFEKVWDDKAMLGRVKSFFAILPSVQSVLDLPPVILGAAGLDPNDQYPGYRKVLLTAAQDRYNTRRKVRDSRTPQFAAQSEHETREWEHLTKWDHILDTSDDLRITTVERILKLAR